MKKEKLLRNKEIKFLKYKENKYKSVKDIKGG